MSCLIGEVNDEGLPLIVTVGVDSIFAKALWFFNVEPPSPVAIRGIIDTGATRSAISSHVVKGFNLSPRETTLVSYGDGEWETELYDVSLSVHSNNSFPALEIPTIRVTRATGLDHLPIWCLIGMDVLARCSLNVDGKNGRFILDW